MKPFCFITVFALLAVFNSCEPTRLVRENEMPDMITIITVDCRNDVQVTNQVKELLRMARVSDWVIRDNGSSQDIEARYRSISPRVQADIEDHLKRSMGVSNVEIRTDRFPLKNP